MNNEIFNNDDYWESFKTIMFAPRRTARTVSDVENIFSLLELKPGMHVLDLCCGIGRFSLEFARRGLRVTGVDLIRVYLDQAAKQAREENLDIQWIQLNMRDFISPNTFDMVVNFDSSFGFYDKLEDDVKVLRNMYDSLKPGGKIIMEMKGKEIFARHVTPKDWYMEEGSGRIIIKERLVSKNWERVELRWLVLDGNKRYDYKFKVRLFSALELSSLLDKSGFTPIHIYGDFTGTDYDYDSGRLVAVGHKPEAAL
jgi:SAM-dependent methyltransferase